MNTYWETAYGKAVGPLEKANDINTKQLAKVTALYNTLDTGTIGVVGGAGSEKALNTAKLDYDGLAAGLYKTKTEAYVKLLADIAGNTEKLALNKYRGAVMTSEVTASKAMET